MTPFKPCTFKQASAEATAPRPTTTSSSVVLDVTMVATKNEFRPVQMTTLTATVTPQTLQQDVV